ncbi:MAG: hypothetical protein GXP05_16310 [Alphaproteobacteria bacterium]|nr:hypothetical protein [Alphaproteobacteria bacterium]
MPNFTQPHFVFLGSTETYGKFVPHPFTQLLQQALDMPCANLAALNAGVEMYLKDPSILLACADARASVIAVMGAHNLSNRFYLVHPRRNDRFIKPSKMLSTLYREVDFSDIHFTRHLLQTLAEADAVKFSIVVDELKSAWTYRMKSLLETIEGRTILLWMSNAPPSEPAEHPPRERTADLGPDPLFVDQQMIDEISPLVTQVIECIAKPEATAASSDGMILCEGDAGAAEKMPGPAFHQQVAHQLYEALSAMK